MSKFTKKVAKALSFAHLTGFAGKQAEDDDKDRREDAEGDEPDKEEQDREDGNTKKGKRAEDDDKKDEAEGDDSDDGDKENDEGAKKAKGSKADDEDAEDDDDDDEMRGKSAAASARRRERARCAAIFGSKAAGRNPALAANLAFNTTMTRKEALAVLESTPAASGGGDLAQGRSSRNPGIGASGSPSPSNQQRTAGRWDAAFKKVSPRR